MPTTEVSGSYSYSCSCSYFIPAPAPPLVPPQFEGLGFELTKERLIEIGYPAEISFPFGGWVILTMMMVMMYMFM